MKHIYYFYVFIYIYDKIFKNINYSFLFYCIPKVCVTHKLIIFVYLFIYIYIYIYITRF